MYARVAPSDECLPGDDRCADRIVVLNSLFARAKPYCWMYLACVPWCIALYCVSAVVLRSVLSSNNKVDDDDDDDDDEKKERKESGGTDGRKHPIEINFWSRPCRAVIGYPPVDLGCTPSSRSVERL